MSDAFDPYYNWLAIPPEEQPPDYYRLIGTRKYESNADVISHAVDQRMTFLRTFQSGKHSAASQKLLNEIAAARVTLLNPDKKTAYDKQLRASDPKKPDVVAKPIAKAKPLAETESVRTAVATKPPVTVSKPSVVAPAHTIPQTPKAHPSKRRSTAWLVPAVVVGIGGVALLGVVVAILLSGGNEPSETPGNNRPIAENPVLPDQPPPEQTREEKKTPEIKPAPEKPVLPANTQNYALRLTRDKTIDLPSTANDFALGQEFTVEGWLRARFDTRGHQLMGTFLTSPADANDLNGGWCLWLGNGSCVFDLGIGAGMRHSPTVTFPLDNTFHHVAVVATKDQVKLFVDGKCIVEQGFQAPPATPRKTNLYVGSPEMRVGSTEDNWQLDVKSLRVSRAARYKADFLPVATLANDDQVYANYEFGKPNPRNVADLANQKHDLILRSPEWIQLPVGRQPSSVAIKAGPNAQALPALEGQPQELFRNVDLSRQVPRGSVQVNSDHIVRTQGNTPDLLLLPCTVPEQYTITLRATRRQGNDMLGIGLVVGGRQTMLGIDAFPHSGWRTGIDMINGVRGDSSRYAGAHRGQLLPQDQPVEIRVEVAQDRVVAYVAGQQVYRWQGDPAQLSLLGNFQTSSTPGLFVSSWESAIEFQDFKLYTTGSGSSLAQRSTGGDPQAASQGLIKLIDLSRDVLAGSVKISPSGAIITGGRHPDIVQVVTDVPESYSVTLTAKRLTGNEMLGVGLVLAGKQCMLAMDSYPAYGSYSGLDFVRKLRLVEKEYPHPHRGPLLPNNTPCEIRIDVTKDSITAFNNGQQFYRWQGDPIDVSVQSLSALPKKPGLFLNTWEDSFEVTDFKLIPLKAGDSTPIASANSNPIDPDEVPEPTVGSAPEETKRLAMPDAATLKKAVEEVRNLLKSDYDRAKQPAEKIALANKLAQLARTTSDDDVMQCALWDQAWQMAVDGKDLSLSISLIQQQAQTFATDMGAQKVAAAKEMIQHAKTPLEKQQLAESFASIAQRATDDEQYEAAEQLYRQAAALAIKAGDAKLKQEIAARSKALDEYRKQAALGAQAAERLKTEPDNAKANLAYGRFLALVQGDWEAGLPYLKKGSDEALQKLAEADLAKPTDAAAQMALGDLWWDAAQEAKTDDKPLLLARACSWYQDAVVRLTGLNKAKVSKRLDESRDKLVAKIGGKKSPQTRGKTIDLLALMDPQLDRLSGQWQREQDGTLRCLSQGGVLKIYVPYAPADEYDITVVYSQPIIRNDVTVIMPKMGASVAYSFGGNPLRFRFLCEPVGGGANPAELRPAAVLEPGRRYTSLVQIRNTGVRAFFEGKEVINYRTDFKDMQPDVWRRLPDPSRLALATDDPTTFFKFELTEITGQGVLMQRRR